MINGATAGAVRVRRRPCGVRAHDLFTDLPMSRKSPERGHLPQYPASSPARTRGYGQFIRDSCTAGLATGRLSSSHFPGIPQPLPTGTRAGPNASASGACFSVDSLVTARNVRYPRESSRNRNLFKSLSFDVLRKPCCAHIPPKPFDLGPKRQSHRPAADLVDAPGRALSPRISGGEE